MANEKRNKGAVLDVVEVVKGEATVTETIVYTYAEPSDAFAMWVLLQRAEAHGLMPRWN